MEIFDEKIDELLAKHLAGECTAEETAAVGRWLAESPEHRKYLDDLEWLWERSPGGLAPPARAVDTEVALERVKKRLAARRPASPLQWQRGRFWMQAAAVFLCIAAAVYWWPRQSAPEAVHIAATDSALTDTLKDGSIVTLERASGLTLAADFNRLERRLRLQGEAYFQVAHDTTRPFVVEVQGLEVKVVGTAFYVDNVTDPTKVTVYVTEGKVLLFHKGRSVLLVRGMQASYDQRLETLTRDATLPEQGLPNTAAHRMFRFDATPLRIVLEKVNLAYGTRISLKKAGLENCLLTARYNNLSLERVLDLIADSFSFTVEKTSDGYLLDGEACE